MYCAIRGGGRWKVAYLVVGFDIELNFLASESSHSVRVLLADIHPGSVYCKLSTMSTYLICILTAVSLLQSIRWMTSS